MLLRVLCLAAELRKRRASRDGQVVDRLVGGERFAPPLGLHMGVGASFGCETAVACDDVLRIKNLA